MPDQHVLWIRILLIIQGSVAVPHIVTAPHEWSAYPARTWRGGAAHPSRVPHGFHAHVAVKVGTGGTCRGGSCRFQLERGYGIIVDMKTGPRFSTRLLLALLAGALFAGFSTKINYSCPPLHGDINSHCVAFAKAVVHPADLLSNEQGSFVRFVVNLGVVFLTIFALLTIVGVFRARTHRTSSNARQPFE